jgi:hypothetical protein
MDKYKLVHIDVQIYPFHSQQQVSLGGPDWEQLCGRMESCSNNNNSSFKNDSLNVSKV